MAGTITLQGEQELLRKITRLGKSLHGREATNVTRKAARLVRDNIRARLPPDKTGQQRKSIKVRTKRGRVLVWQDMKIATTLHWLEFGTAERFYKTKTGKKKSVGRIKPTRPFSRGRNKSRAAVASILKSGYTLIIERTAKAK